MQPKTVFFGGLAALLLVACNGTATQDDPRDECGAQAHQSLVGQPVASAQWDEALSVRVIDHDSMVTLDYMPTRMNIWVGANGRVEKVDCG